VSCDNIGRRLSSHTSNRCQRLLLTVMESTNQKQKILLLVYECFAETLCSQVFPVKSLDLSIQHRPAFQYQQCKLLRSITANNIPNLCHMHSYFNRILQAYFSPTNSRGLKNSVYCWICTVNRSDLRVTQSTMSSHRRQHLNAA